MFPNAKGSEEISLLATIDPSSQAVGVLTTSWISVANFHALLATVETGVLGASAMVDAQLQQALDASGTSSKIITNKSITQLQQAASGSNKYVLINCKPEELDTVNGFGFVRLSITVGVAASLTAGKLLGVNPRYATADAFNGVNVAQLI